MVVYYLPTKADLVFAATTAVSVKLQQLLAEAFGDERRDPDALVRRAWPVLTTPAAERIFAIFFEAIGLAAAGTDPYDQLVPAMMEAWLDWLTARSTGASASVRRRNALAVIARVDGLLLVRQTLGADASNEAAESTGDQRSDEMARSVSPALRDVDRTSSGCSWTPRSASLPPSGCSGAGESSPRASGENRLRANGVVQ